MSKAKLREKLETLPKENVINLMMSLYNASKEAKTYLEFYLTPDSYAEVEKYKKIIQNEFFPARDFSEKPSFATCRKAISEFKKLNPAPECLADLMLFYIEQGCEYTMTFGDMWEQHYVTLEKTLRKPWSSFPLTDYCPTTTNG